MLNKFSSEKENIFSKWSFHTNKIKKSEVCVKFLERFGKHAEQEQKNKKTKQTKNISANIIDLKGKPPNEYGHRLPYYVNI